MGYMDSNWSREGRRKDQMLELHSLYREVIADYFDINLSGTEYEEHGVENTDVGESAIEHKKALGLIVDELEDQAGIESRLENFPVTSEENDYE